MKETILYKKKAQFYNMNEMIVTGIIESMDTDIEIPLIYQYLHEPEKTVIPNDKNTIGTVSNIRFNEHEDVLIDVEISPFLQLSANYQGEIDNIFVNYDINTKDVTIGAFIIYDKIAKKDIEIQKMQSTSNYPKSGEIPLMTNVDNNMMKDITENLIEEYEKLVDSQHSTNMNKKEVH